MELKLTFNIIKIKCRGLLIVPYGIETALADALDKAAVAFNRTLWN